MRGHEAENGGSAKTLLIPSWHHVPCYHTVAPHLGDGGAQVAVRAHQLQVGVRLDLVQEPLRAAGRGQGNHSSNSRFQTVERTHHAEGSCWSGPATAAGQKAGRANREGKTVCYYAAGHLRMSLHLGQEAECQRTRDPQPCPPAGACCGCRTWSPPGRWTRTGAPGTRKGGRTGRVSRQSGGWAGWGDGHRGRVGDGQRRGGQEQCARTAMQG